MQTILQMASKVKVFCPTRGQSANYNELSDVKREDFKPCDREVVLYNNTDASQKIQGDDDDLPEEFFQLTEAEIRKLWADTQRQTRELQNAPLMTKAMRKARQEEKYAKYQRVAIRFHFPDRLILQALFEPRESVYALQMFITMNLHDENMPFYLYTSPPKIVLKDKHQNLIEVGLAPMSVVYVGFEDKHEHYLSSELLSQQATREQAAMMLYKHMPNKQASTSGEQSVSQPSTSNSSTNQRQKASGKVPKWFKVGKK